MPRAYSKFTLVALLPLATLTLTQLSLGQAGSVDALQKATQNPVANITIVPFENDTNFNIFGRDGNVFSIQPSGSDAITPSWNLITRVSVPVVYEPALGLPALGAFGLGDLQPTFLFSPSKPGGLIWGVGPAFQFPSATNSLVGTGKWEVGASAVALVQPGSWTFGLQLTNLWSAGGHANRPSVNAGMLQYFVYRDLSNGWYLTSAPTLINDWRAPGAAASWLIPVGGGIGRIFKIGAQPINANLAYYSNVHRPSVTLTGTWQLQMQMALLFPH